MLISAVQQCESVTVKYIYSFPLSLPPLPPSHPSRSSQSAKLGSMLHSVALLFIHPKCNSLHLLIPASHSIPPPPLPPLATTNLWVCFSVSEIDSSLHHILHSTYRWYRMVFLFLITSCALDDSFMWMFPFFHLTHFSPMILRSVCDHLEGRDLNSSFGARAVEEAFLKKGMPSEAENSLYKDTEA